MPARVANISAPPATTPDPRELPKRPHVALIVETSIIYGRGILRGISRYLGEHGPWSIFLEQRELEAKPPKWIDTWDGDGIITRSPTDQLLHSGLPTVGLFDLPRCDVPIPMIHNDNIATGRMAAKHLMGTGLKQFAYVGIEGKRWSEMRMAGAQAALTDAGYEIELYKPRTRTKHVWESLQADLGQWLADLPKPLGLFCGNDLCGQRALDACRRVDIAVPEEVAVVAVDNDEAICDLCTPPLSSIQTNAARVGYEAAALLDRMMQGETIEPTTILIEPMKVVPRQSTDLTALDDPDIARAVHFIREHACDGISVSMVLQHVPLSRRVFEHRFAKIFGCSPKSMIRDQQIKRAKQLLVESDLSIERVSQMVGFQQAAYLCAVFKSETGTTPARYRRKNAVKKGLA